MKKYAGSVVVVVLLLPFLTLFAQNTWQPQNGPYGGWVFSILSLNSSDLLIGTDRGGIFKSSNGGVSWFRYSSGLPGRASITCLRKIGENIFAGSWDGKLFVSKDLGTSWTKSGKFSTDSRITEIESSAGKIFVASANNGIFCSTDEGVNWNSADNGLTSLKINTLKTLGNGDILAGTSGSNVFRSTDNGLSWQPAGFPQGMSSLNRIISTPDTNLIAATGDGVYRSEDGGLSWTKSGNGISSGDVYGFAAIDTSIYALAGGISIYRSDDDGISWTKTSGDNYWIDVSCLISFNNKLFVGTRYSGILTSSDLGSSWVESNKGLSNQIVQTIYKTKEGSYFAGTEGSGIFRSGDNGASWTSSFNNGYIFVKTLLQSQSGDLFAGTSGGVYRSTNKGASWQEVNNGIANTNKMVNALAMDSKGNIYAGLDYEDGVFKSTDNGNSWEKILSAKVYSLAVNQANDVFAGTNAGVFRLLDGEQVWRQVNSGLSNSEIYTVYVNSAGDIFAGTRSSGVFRSSDKGNEWVKAGTELNGKWIKAINGSSIGSYLLLGTDADGCFLSEDNGDHWRTLNEGLGNLSVQALWVDSNDRCLLGTNGNSIYAINKFLARPDAPLLSSPAKDTVNQNIKLTFKWLKSQRADLYHFQLSKDQNFSNLIGNDSSLSATEKYYELSNNTKYYWRVRAKNASGYSPWSGAWNFTTVIAAPEKPYLAYPMDNSVDLPIDLTLKWNKSTRAENYILQVSPDSTFSSLALSDSSVADTLKRVNPLVNNMKYYWRVKALNIGGEGNWSQIWDFLTVIAAPNHPALNQPANNAQNQPVDLKLKWRKIKDAEKYHLQISTLADFTNLVVNDEALTDTIKQAAGLKNNTSYYWRVRAINIGGSGSWSGVWIFKTIVALPPAPVLLSPANGSKGQPVSLKLSWNPSQNAAAYRVLVSQDTLFASLITDDSTLTASSKDISALKNGMRYYWKVSSRNIAGISSYSPQWSFTTILPSPEAFSAETYGLGKVKLSWTDKTDNESGFILERNTDKESGYKLIDTIKANTISFIDSTVSLSTTYKYRLKAYTQFALSAYTPEVTVTTLTSVKDLKDIPSEYALMQNFPNPFNPSTVIRYSLPGESKVRISVFNSLGQIVSELINKLQPAGYYEEVFNAGNLPSGIYIYSITVQSADGKNNFSSARKMMLVK